MKTGIKRLEKGYETTMKEVDTVKTYMQENIDARYRLVVECL